MKKHRARQFPEGKIHEHDQGVIQIRVAADPARHVVVVGFPSPVTWFALPKSRALALAEMIRNNAEKLPDVPEVNSPPAEGVQ